MSYRQGEEELFRRLKRKRFIKETQNDRRKAQHISLPSL
jgi:hypothetical protein